MHKLHSPFLLIVVDYDYKEQCHDFAKCLYSSNLIEMLTLWLTLLLCLTQQHIEESEFTRLAFKEGVLKDCCSLVLMTANS